MTTGDLADLYDGVILDRSRAPRHRRRLEPADAVGQGDNALCGDKVEVRVRRSGDGRLQDVAFEGRGCALSIASADLMAELLHDRDPADVRPLYDHLCAMLRDGRCAEAGPELDSLHPFVGVHEYPSRIKCVTLPWRALISALETQGDRP